MDLEQTVKVVGLSGAGLFLGGTAYVLVLDFLAELPLKLSRKIGSQEELDQIVKQEAEKLRITGPIKAILHEEFEGVTSQSEDGTYQVDVGGLCATRSGVRHELAHIANGDVDSNHSPQNTYFHLVGREYCVV